MDPIFVWIEQTAFSTWVRESPSVFVFPGTLVLHAIGMALLVGTNTARDLRILGIARGVPLSALDKFSPIMKLGLFLNAVSGVVLLITYPAKALTNPVFYFKLVLIALGLLFMRWLMNHVVRNPDMESRPASIKARVLAVASMACWAGAITSGRLLAYTHSVLLVS